jgi:hypothetical protein
LERKIINGWKLTVNYGVRKTYILISAAYPRRAIYHLSLTVNHFSISVVFSEKNVSFFRLLRSDVPGRHNVDFKVFSPILIGWKKRGFKTASVAAAQFCGKK